MESFLNSELYERMFWKYSFHLNSHYNQSFFVPVKKYKKWKLKEGGIGIVNILLLIHNEIAQ